MFKKTFKAKQLGQPDKMIFIPECPTLISISKAISLVSKAIFDKVTKQRESCEFSKSIFISKCNVID